LVSDVYKALILDTKKERSEMSAVAEVVLEDHLLVELRAEAVISTAAVHPMAAMTVADGHPMAAMTVADGHPMAAMTVADGHPLEAATAVIVVALIDHHTVAVTVEVSQEEVVAAVTLVDLGAEVASAELVGERAVTAGERVTPWRRSHRVKVYVVACLIS